MFKTMYFIYHSGAHMNPHLEQINKKKFDRLTETEEEVCYELTIPINNKYTCYNMDGVDSNEPTVVFDAFDQADNWANEAIGNDIRLVIHKGKIAFCL